MTWNEKSRKGRPQSAWISHLKPLRARGLKKLNVNHLSNPLILDKEWPRGFPGFPFCLTFSGELSSGTWNEKQHGIWPGFNTSLPQFWSPWLKWHKAAGPSQQLLVEASGDHIPVRCRLGRPQGLWMDIWMYLPPQIQKWIGVICQLRAGATQEHPKVFY